MRSSSRAARRDRGDRLAPTRRQPRRRMGSGSAPRSAVRWLLGPRAAAGRSSRTSAGRRDVLLGVDRVRGSQLIKQADVVMLHHLVPDEVEPASLAANLAFYEPRTAHGSSLSPAIHASLLARAGRPDRTRVVPSGRSPRPRRPHRHHCRWPAPGDDGRGLAGPGLRIPRVAPRRGAPGRTVPSPIVDGARTPLAVRRPPDRRARRPRLDHRQLCRARGGTPLWQTPSICSPPGRTFTQRRVET